MSRNLSTSREPAGDRLFALQALRAIAALLVTIAHASEEAKYYFKFQPLFDTDPFGKGVDLFFVLSGFIIYFSAIGSKSTTPPSPIRFIQLRFIRVAPLYYVFTTLLVLVIYFTPSGVKEAIFDPNQIITSYLFLPYERYDGRIAPTLSLGWTLNYEMFFYAIFALTLAWQKRRIALTVILVICSLAFIGALVPQNFPAPIREWTDSIILEFAFGIFIAKGYEKFGRPRSTRWIPFFCLSLVGFALLYYLNLPQKPFPLPRFASAGIPAAVIVASCVFLVSPSTDSATPKLLIALGDSSYSLYLSHRFVQRPIQMMLRKYELAPAVSPGLTYLVLAVSAACLAGHIVYKTLEVPLLKFLKRKLAYS